MKPLTAGMLAIAMFVGTVAVAQIKTIPGDSITATATVEAIERTSRLLTLKRSDGAQETIMVPVEVKRFDALKVGDRITATYSEKLELRVMKPGEKAVDSSGESLVPADGTRPGATVTAQRTITATITAIDHAIPSITLSGPGNTTISKRVTDKAALKQVKVGDRLAITWTASVLLAAAPPK